MARMHKTINRRAPHSMRYGDFAAAFGSGRLARRLIVLCISNPNPNPSLVRDM